MMSSTIRSIVFLALCLVAAPALACAADVSISVDPMVFEFKAGYGSSQQSSVTITNTGSTAEQVSVHAVDWHVNGSGSVSLDTIGSEGTRSLTPFLKLEPSLFVLQRGEARTLTVSVQMPAPARGEKSTRWGGFLLEASPVGNAGIHTGATVFVYNSAGDDEPRLTLRALSITTEHGRKFLVARLANYSEAYARPIVHVAVKHGDDTVRDDTVPVNTLLPGDDRVVRLPVHLPATHGTYEVHLIVDYGDAVLDGSTNVRVP